MSRIGGAIQRINEAAFGLAALCLLGLVALSATLVLARYGLGWSAVAAQEAVLYLHALLVALGLAGALQHGAHVRIDILQRRWDATRRRRVDQLGVLLLALPFCAFVLWSCADYVAVAWQRREASAEPGGLAWLWLLKSLLLVFPLQLAAAALLLAWGPQAETPHEPPTSPPSADTPPGGEGGR